MQQVILEEALTIIVLPLIEVQTIKDRLPIETLLEQALIIVVQETQVIKDRLPLETLLKTKKQLQVETQIEHVLQTGVQALKHVTHLLGNRLRQHPLEGSQKPVVVHLQKQEIPLRELHKKELQVVLNQTTELLILPPDNHVLNK